MSTPETRSDAGTQESITANREGVITQWGGEWAKALGYSSEEALGQSVALIIPPVLQARHWRGFKKAVASGQLKRAGATLKVPAIHKGGSVLAIQGTLTLDQADDGAVEAVTLRLLGQGPRWAPPVWRAVLGALKAVEAIRGRILPSAPSQ